MAKREAAAKPGMVAELKAQLTPKPRLVTAVTDVLGAKLTAYVLGVKDTRTIAKWAHTGDFDLLTQKKLQGALAAITLLQERHTADAIAPWFTFITDALDDVSPSAILRQAIDEDDVERATARVIAAARRALAD